jgi:hypothetical protein
MSVPNAMGTVHRACDLTASLRAVGESGVNSILHVCSSDLTIHLMPVEDALFIFDEGAAYSRTGTALSDETAGALCEEYGATWQESNPGGRWICRAVPPAESVSVAIGDVERAYMALVRAAGELARPPGAPYWPRPAAARKRAPVFRGGS